MALVAGLLIRVAVLTQTTGLGTPIIDEQHYTQLAGNLLQDNGFAWGPSQPTSIRPPVYPAFVAAIWSIAGENNYQAVRVVQVVLSALTAWVVLLIGREYFSDTTGRIAAAVTWLYPSLIFFNVTLLTETLYTFLLMLFVLFLARSIHSSRLTTAAVAGAVLGLVCLTRSSLWPLPLVLCPFLLVALSAPVPRRIAVAVVLLAGYTAVVAPWAVRNTRLQGVLTIVDTMGGLNLRMGNYEYTPEDRMWDAVSIEGERSWAHALRQERPGQSLTEGEKDKWAQRKAFQYMVAHPGTTLRRCVIRLADFWGLEREFAAGVAHGMFVPPRWVGIAASGAMVISFIVIALTGTTGIWLARPRSWRADVALLLPATAIMAAHALTFGHSRYHIPLIPILALYASACWSGSTSTVLERRFALAGAALSVMALSVVWIRQLLVVDAQRIRGFFAYVW
jgi:4-amino-4-deoxy-L-arabinose transferase-like glycosyltransferase